MSQPSDRPSIKKRLLTIGVLSMAAASIWYEWMLFGPGSSEVNLAITTLDAAGTPIANANVAVYARDYGVFDTSVVVYLGKTGPDGKVRITAPAPGPVSQASVVAWDASFDRHGTTSRCTYASNLMLGSWFSAMKYDIPSVHFRPNQGAMVVELSPIPLEELSGRRRAFEHAANKAETTQFRLQRLGLVPEEPGKSN